MKVKHVKNSADQKNTFQWFGMWWFYLRRTYRSEYMYGAYCIHCFFELSLKMGPKPQRLPNLILLWSLKMSGYAREPKSPNREHESILVHWLEHLWPSDSAQPHRGTTYEHGISSRLNWRSCRNTMDKIGFRVCWGLGAHFNGRSCIQSYRYFTGKLTI